MVEIEWLREAPFNVNLHGVEREIREKRSVSFETCTVRQGFDKLPCRIADGIRFPVSWR